MSCNRSRDFWEWTELDVGAAARRWWLWSDPLPCSESSRREKGGRAEGDSGRRCRTGRAAPATQNSPGRFVQGVDRGGLNETNPSPPAGPPCLISSDSKGRVIGYITSS